MLNMTLGSGIMWASLFLALGTIAVVWINNIYKSCNGQEPATSSDSGSTNNGIHAHNGYVRKGEHDESIRSLHQRLDDMHKDSRNWWKQLNEKVDTFSQELRQSIAEQQQTNKELHQRITAIETIQETCPARFTKEGKS